ncbi:D-alanyl-D-alanine carboxypeptidase family protein [Halobacillus sp. MO56]
MNILQMKRFVQLFTILSLILLLSWPMSSSARDKDDILLVNKQSSLSEDYIPADLVTPDVAFSGDEEQLQAKAAAALEAMFTAAERDGVQLYAASGYRSYQYQKGLFQFWVDQYGEAQASRVSAKPGHSEHQTGLTMDVTSKDVDFQLKKSFGKTRAGHWIEKHAAEYGFIIRYQENKEPVTGYDYEPWHLRYVGKDHAKIITNYNIALETYLSHDMDSMPNTYTVQGGDTFYSIAKNNGTTVEHVLALNPEIKTRSLPVGAEIQLPGQDVHIVKKGDTISEVAAKYSGVTPELLMDVNDHVDPNQLPIDAAINIP